VLRRCFGKSPWVWPITYGAYLFHDRLVGGYVAVALRSGLPAALQRKLFHRSILRSRGNGSLGYQNWGFLFALQWSPKKQSSGSAVAAQQAHVTKYKHTNSCPLGESPITFFPFHSARGCKLVSIGIEMARTGI